MKWFPRAASSPPRGGNDYPGRDETWLAAAHTHQAQQAQGLTEARTGPSPK